MGAGIWVVPLRGVPWGWSFLMDQFLGILYFCEVTDTPVRCDLSFLLSVWLLEAGTRAGEGLPLTMWGLPAMMFTERKEKSGLFFMFEQMRLSTKA